MKTVIIGGDAAGMSAAAKLRRIRKTWDITVYEKGSYLSYASCGLPYYVASGAMEVDKLIQRTQADFEKTGIRVCCRCEVTEVLAREKKVRVRNLDTGEVFEDAFDRLVIATGADAVIPPVPGTELEGVYTLKNVPDGLALKQALSSRGIRELTIVGGGYIGVETAEALAPLGLKIRVIQKPDRLLKNFEPEMSDAARQELERLGVEVKTGETLLAVRGKNRVEQVVTDKGSYPAQAVLLAAGVVPATGFLKDSGIALAGNGAVVIDRQMRTNLPDIFAAGDCAQIYHLLRKENVYIPLATTANKCGRLLGEILAGRQVFFPGTLGSAAIKVGRLELARTGLTEAEARQMGLEVKSVVVNAADRPGYYPGSTPITFKMIYEAGTRRVLGVQGMGEKGVVLRIDIFAAAITAGMTADQVGMLDLCYAPPFATTWDAVHVAANLAK